MEPKVSCGKCRVHVFLGRASLTCVTVSSLKQSDSCTVLCQRENMIITNLILLFLPVMVHAVGYYEDWWRPRKGWFIYPSHTQSSICSPHSLYIHSLLVVLPAVLFFFLSFTPSVCMLVCVWFPFFCYFIFFSISNWLFTLTIFWPFLFLIMYSTLDFTFALVICLFFHLLWWFLHFFKNDLWPFFFTSHFSHLKIHISLIHSSWYQECIFDVSAFN